MKRGKPCWNDTTKMVVMAILSVIFSGIVRAIALYTFVSPNHFAPGGINGIAVLLEFGTGWNSGYFLLMLNLPLFFVAFFLLGKKQAIIATASMLLTSGLVIAFAYIPNFPQYGEASTGTNMTVSGLLAAIAGGILLGVALAIMLRSCGTAGGTGVLATLVHRKWRNLSVSWLTSAFDACVVFASYFVYYNQGNNFTERLDPVLLALVSLFVTSKACDIILQGFKVAYKFEIITNHPNELAQEIMDKTRHGVTMMPAVGMYSHEQRSMLVCIIRKRQLAEVQKIIKKYPDTFTYFSSTSEVIGKFLK